MTTPTLKLLAIDTSTEVLSVAVARTQHGQTQLWQHTGPGAAKASTGLIASVLDLMQQSGMALRELDAICFGSGPGSFTGLRTACSVAQGLGFGAGVPLLGIHTLMAVAEEARGLVAGAPAAGAAPESAAAQPAMLAGQVVLSLIDARMDEVYAAAYQWSGAQWQALSDSLLLRPQDLPVDRWADADVWVAGNALGPYASRLPQRWQQARHIEALPTARAMLRLAPQLLAQGLAVPAEQALPAYIRDKVAQTTAEREALRAAQAASRPAQPAKGGAGTPPRPGPAAGAAP